MTQIHTLPLDLPARYYSAIGQVLVRWSLLEFKMQELIWRAMGLDNKQGRTLTVGTPAPALMGTLQTLPLRWVTNQATVRAIRDLGKSARELYPTRNALAHGVWGYPRGDQRSHLMLHYMKAKEERILPRAKRMTPKDVVAVADQIRDLNKNAARLIVQITADKKAATPRTRQGAAPAPM